MRSRCCCWRNTCGNIKERLSPWPTTAIFSTTWPDGFWNWTAERAFRGRGTILRGSNKNRNESPKKKKPKTKTEAIGARREIGKQAAESPGTRTGMGAHESQRTAIERQGAFERV